MKQPQYNTALYMRLSRDDESFGDSVSIETQRTVLTQFVREHPERSEEHTSELQSPS